MDEKVTFSSEGALLEGLLNRKSLEKGVIITHPHPLYGGDMENQIVSVIKEVYAQNGYTTLRFNFRGTGRSQGTFDDGQLEQADLAAAYAYFVETGITSVVLAGYSFGAWVLAHAALKYDLASPLVLVAPPIKFMGFEKITTLNSLQLVVSGKNDTFSDVAELRECVPLWNKTARLYLIDHADHFFSGTLPPLKSILMENID